MQQGYVDLSHIETLILNEADRMLDMGFINDLQRIVQKVPRKRQTLMFSATMPPAIRTLSKEWLTDPADVRVTPTKVAVEAIRQSVFFIDQKQKLQLLIHWLRETPWTRTLVFTRTKHGADKVAAALLKADIPADAFHGNKSQSARQRALARFKSPRPLVLVATDIAARGLDIDMVSHVINYDLPVDVENYVHRIGRTGRAGADGAAVSFCDQAERATLRDIQHLTRQTLSVEAHPAGIAAPVASPPAKASAGTRKPARGKGPAPTKYRSGRRSEDRRRAAYAGRR